MPLSNPGRRPRAAPGNMLRIQRSPAAKAFLISFALHLLVLLPILIADRFIFDDLGRATEGWILWINDGRPLADFVMRLTNLGSPWVDFSPLPQIGALICYSGLAVLIMQKFKIGSPVVAALTALPLGLNPFTLENFARKYDSLSMALSVLCMLAPILLTLRNPRLDLFLGAAWLISGLSLYQASLNLFLVFAVVEVVWEQRRGADLSQLFRLVLTRALALLLALFIYHFIAAATVRGDHPSQISALALSVSDLPLIAHNFLIDWDFLLSSLPRLYRNLIFGTVVLGLLSMLATQIRYLRTHMQKATLLTKAAVFLIGLLLPIVWLAGSTGFLILLRNASVVVPHFLIGTGGLVASALILVLAELETWRVSTRWQAILLAPIGYVLIMFGAVFANAVKEQRLYEQRIGSRLALDLRRLAAVEPFDFVLYHGNVGLAPMVVHAAKRFRLIGNLVEVELAEYSGFFRAALHYFGVIVPTEVIDAGTASRIATGAMSPAVEDPNFDVYRNGDQLVILLK
jgi:hypothetical protein